MLLLFQNNQFSGTGNIVDPFGNEVAPENLIILLTLSLFYLNHDKSERDQMTTMLLS